MEHLKLPNGSTGRRPGAATLPYTTTSGDSLARTSEGSRASASRAAAPAAASMTGTTWRCSRSLGFPGPPRPRSGDPRPAIGIGDGPVKAPWRSDASTSRDQAAAFLARLPRLAPQGAQESSAGMAIPLQARNGRGDCASNQAATSPRPLRRARARRTTFDPTGRLPGHAPTASSSTSGCCFAARAAARHERVTVVERYAACAPSTRSAAPPLHYDNDRGLVAEVLLRRAAPSTKS